MKVKDLIEQLKGYPEDTELVYYDAESCHGYDRVYSVGLNIHSVLGVPHERNWGYHVVQEQKEGAVLLVVLGEL